MMDETEVSCWRSAIGPRADRYLQIFDRVARKEGGWVAGWNWAAFLIRWNFHTGSALGEWISKAAL